MRRFVMLMTLALAALLAVPAQADDLGYIMPRPGIGTSEVTGVAPLTLGWSFQFRGGYPLYGLGLFDTGTPGFAESHEVALWDASGAKLLSVIVGPGSADFGGMGIVQTPGYVLAPGFYTLSASNLGGIDGYVGVSSGFPASPYVRYLASRWAPGPAAQFPFLTSTEMRFGPSMWFVVPEPSVWLMFILGFGAMGAMLRRRRGPKVICA